MHRIDAPKLPLDSEVGRALDQCLIYLDDTEGWPFRSDRGRCPWSGGKRHCAECLDESDTAYEPRVCCAHQSPQHWTLWFSDIALDQSTGVKVEVQDSASRSARTSREAELAAETKAGAFKGRSRAGRTSRPSATSRRSASSPAVAPAGTMSATGLPRWVMRTCSPRPTARRTALSDCLRSRTPTVRMWTH